MKGITSYHGRTNGKAKQDNRLLEDFIARLRAGEQIEPSNRAGRRLLRKARETLTERTD